MVEEKDKRRDNKEVQLRFFFLNMNVANFVKEQQSHKNKARGGEWRQRRVNKDTNNICH